MQNSLTIPQQFTALLPMLSVTHIMPVLVLLSVVGVGMQQGMICN